MLKLDSMDLINELVELFREIIQESSLQLDYYRASVYKNETAEIIKNKIQQLKLLSQIIGDDELKDAFLDFEATVTNGNQKIYSGECFFSARVIHLFNCLGNRLKEIESSSMLRDKSTPIQKKFTRTIQKHRRQLLSMCRQGSDHWCFFQHL